MKKTYALALHSVEPNGQGLRTEFVPVTSLGEHFALLDKAESFRDFDLWLRQRETRQFLNLSANPVAAIQLVSYGVDQNGRDDPATIETHSPAHYLNATRIDLEDKPRHAPTHTIHPALYSEATMFPETASVLETRDGTYFTHVVTDIVVKNREFDGDAEAFVPFSKRLKDCKKYDRQQEKSGNFVQQAIELVRTGVSSLFKHAPRLG